MKKSKEALAFILTNSVIVNRLSDAIGMESDAPMALKKKTIKKMIKDFKKSGPTDAYSLTFGLEDNQPYRGYKDEPQHHSNKRYHNEELNLSDYQFDISDLDDIEKIIK